MRSFEALDSAGVPSQHAKADAREHFMAREPEQDIHIRRMILASWQRSRESDVDIDRIRVPYLRDPDLEAPLYRSAAPILDMLGEQLQSESVSIILTDHAGIVLDRRTPSHEMAAALDRVHLAPGFSYAEQFAGTNGIGTALSSGRATLVDGREHYSHELGQFACAGAPIKHPTRGKIVGLLDLTSWSTAPGAMLTALASATAKQIEQELLAQTGMRELALFSEYVRTCQQSNGPVLALNNDVVMSNNHLRQALNLAEQEALTAYAIDTMQSAVLEVMRTVTLPCGRSAHLRYTPVRCESGLAGGVFRIRMGPAEQRATGGTMLTGRPVAPTVLPGLVGSGAIWTRCVQQVDSRYRAGDWMALEGEPGSGKRALLRAAHRLHHPAAPFRVFEAPTAEDFDGWLTALLEGLARPDALIVLANAERLTAQQATTVGELMSEASTDPDTHARVAMTISSDAPTTLRTVFPRTVDVPPLRHHIDDLPDLVGHLLSQLPNAERLTCPPKVLSTLARLNWPGNVAQLRNVLVYVLQHRRAGEIELADLPPECRTTGRRVLTPIEALERDAIVNALHDQGESPTTAARMLGMSRATIYRKIRQYDITLTPAREV
ncbi:MAG: modulated sigma54 specific transcriptional regulator, Fis family [Pseudonocardiales bacterium]|nr:modulated sigma54 specific transcriptional regulator, Fis family [Pseudonocardiales bacterium]